MSYYEKPDADRREDQPECICDIDPWETHPDCHYHGEKTEGEKQMEIYHDGPIEISISQICEGFAQMHSDRQAAFIETLFLTLHQFCGDSKRERDFNYRVQLSMIRDCVGPFTRMFFVDLTDNPDRCPSSNWQCVKAIDHDGLHAYEPKAQIAQREHDSTLGACSMIPTPHCPWCEKPLEAGGLDARYCGDCTVTYVRKGVLVIHPASPHYRAPLMKEGKFDDAK